MEASHDRSQEAAEERAAHEATEERAAHEASEQRKADEAAERTAAQEAVSEEGAASRAADALTEGGAADTAAKGVTEGAANTAAKAAQVDAPAGDAVPWLLLRTTATAGKRFREVSFIQRLATQGGKAPATGCDAAHAGAELRVDYSADYYFYKGGIATPDKR